MKSIALTLAVILSSMTIAAAAEQAAEPENVVTEASAEPSEDEAGKIGEAK